MGKRFPGLILRKCKKLCFNMDSKLKLIIDSFGTDRFKANESLKEYTALKVGGPAKLLFVSFTNTELTRLIKMCRELKVPFFLFGTGSKMMISDAGFEGIVIKNRTKNIQTISVKGKVTKFGIGVQEALIEVDAGVSINKFCEYLDSQKLEMMGFLGLPGSIGGNIFLSRFLQASVKSIKILDSVSDIEQISAEELNPKKHIVLSAVFRVKAK